MALVGLFRLLEPPKSSHIIAPNYLYTPRASGCLVAVSVTNIINVVVVVVVVIENFYTV